MKKSVVLDNRRKLKGAGLKLRSDHNNTQYNWLEIAKIGSREKNKSWLEKLRLKAISASNLKLKSKLSMAKLCLKEDAKVCWKVSTDTMKKLVEFLNSRRKPEGGGTKLKSNHLI